MEVKAIAIGGSAGSFKVIVELLTRLPKGFDIPVFLCLHRLKHVRTGFVEALSLRSNLQIREPFDKDPIENGKIYLAPANYHMYINEKFRFALSTEDTINHSRPSIDLLMSSAADVYGEQLLSIILSGANRDGARGMEEVHKQGGKTIVQDPQEAQVNTMPLSTIELIKPDLVLSSKQIIELLSTLK